MKRIYMMSQGTPEGRARVNCLYVFEVTPRVKDRDGNDVTPFRASGIPGGFVGRRSDQMASNDPVRALMDSGDAGFVQTELWRSAGETAVEFNARSRKDFDGMVAFAIDRAREKAIESGHYDRHRSSQAW